MAEVCEDWGSPVEEAKKKPAIGERAKGLSQDKPNEKARSVYPSYLSLQAPKPFVELGSAREYRLDPLEVVNRVRTLTVALFEPFYKILAISRE